MGSPDQPGCDAPDDPSLLRKIGIEISFDRQGRARTRTIRISATPNPAAPEYARARPSAPSASSAPKPKPISGFAGPDLLTVSTNADGRGKNANPTVRESASKTGAEDAVDGNFDLMPGAEVEL